MPVRLPEMYILFCRTVPFPQHHMSRGGGTGGGGGHWKESPKKNAMNELQDKLMTVRLREAQGQAELREVKLKALQLESQVRRDNRTPQLYTT